MIRWQRFVDIVLLLIGDHVIPNDASTAVDELD